MKRQDFTFDLPDHLIAQSPPAERGQSRMLCLDREKQAITDSYTADIADLLEPGDLLVMNDTRVIPARLFGQKSTGGRVELLLERILDEEHFVAQVRASKSPKPGNLVRIDNGPTVTMKAREDDLFLFSTGTEEGEGPMTPLELFETLGHMPLPPYITREDSMDDKDRYQTVYARESGAVAAPTAGLHFTEPQLEDLLRRGIRIAWVTLHVGSGTFSPVRADNIEQHKMHSERYSVSEQTCRLIRETRAAGKRVIAVGTTVVRTLETLARDAEEAGLEPGMLKAGEGETDIFIYPGFRFRVIDALLTNFHLPESSLIMLVCAFAGRDFVLKAYEHAVEQEYRFFSYGDAMFIV